jgi:Protein kinase domain/PEGA domain
MSDPNAPDTETFPRDFGEYTLLGELGRGMMGIVYDAVDKRLGRPVALKLLRAEIEPGSAVMERFRREARACAQVRHANIVEIYEAGEVDGRPYFAMEKVEGDSLSVRAERGELPEAREFLGQVAGLADALHALHLANIVHRDVKPSNIIVDSSGKMVLADFGLARAAFGTELTQTGEALGTPRYMSPEQVLGKKDAIDGRSDIYSLGSTLYEVLAGRPVFEADDTRGMLHKILMERPGSLRSFAPDLDADAEAIVLKSLEKRPEDRYLSAARMRDDLLAFSRGESVEGRPVPALTHFLRRRRFHLLGAAVLLVAVALTGLWYQGRPAVLSILSTPPARVILDGRDLGLTPVTGEFAAGEYKLEMRLPGFNDHRQAIELRAGERRTLERVLAATDAADPVALGQLAAAFEIPVAMMEPTTSMDADVLAMHEGVKPPAPVDVLFPRGEVASSDLGNVLLTLDAKKPSDGALEVRRGGQVVFSKRLESRDGAIEERLPEELIRQLKSGDKLTWGYFPDKGAPVTAEVQVVPDDVKRKVLDLETRLKGHDPRILAMMKAQLYLSRGLYYAAFREARDLAETHGDHLGAQMLVCQALEKMNLGDTALCQETRRHVHRIAARQRAAIK